MRKDREIEELLNYISKRFQTTMIGSLAKFEESFGYLWEDDSKNGDHYYDIWQETRNSILNNGNHQMRVALDELSEYLYDKKSKYKYHYKFYFDNNQPHQDRGDTR
jgi:hypothetical protein